MTRPTSVLLLLLALASAAVADDRRILLFNSFANGEKTERPIKPKRARFIEPDFAALEAPPSLRRNEHAKASKKLTAALFDDKVVHIELESVERNVVDATIWYGKIEGDETSSVTLVVKDHALVASIATGNDRYAIEPVENGAHEALELDPAAFPAESEPLRPVNATAVMADIVANDSAAFVDVLVAYTDDVRSSLGSTAAAQAAASNAIAAANVAYQNSGVTFRARLAGTTEVSYAETGNIGTLLSALRSPNDGQIDQVHTLRNQLGADDVALLALNGGSSCGIAYVMTSPSAGFEANAFAVVVNSCAVGNLSFPHELGHNFGLEHDRFVAPGGTPAYPYGFGYVDTGFQFRDIMAYANACGSCPRIQYFSSPLLTYLGRPLGVSYESAPSTSADNVRALNNVASILANWRQSSTYTPATFTDNPLVAGQTVVKALHITELRTAINNYRASVGLGAATWTSIGAGSSIRASHITEMRTALIAAMPSATFTNPLGTGGAVRAVHVQELRNYLD